MPKIFGRMAYEHQADLEARDRASSLLIKRWTAVGHVSGPARASIQLRWNQDDLSGGSVVLDRSKISPLSK
jgi:hypothetical protein